MLACVPGIAVMLSCMPIIRGVVTKEVFVHQQGMLECVFIGNCDHVEGGVCTICVVCDKYSRHECDILGMYVQWRVVSNIGLRPRHVDLLWTLCARRVWCI